MPQTTVNSSPAIALDGQDERSAPQFNESLVVDEALGIPFGRAVVLKSAANLEVDLPVSGAEAADAYGVSVRNPTQAANSSLYSDNDGITVKRAGAVWVLVEDAVTKGDTVFIRHTAGASLTVLGRFRSDDGAEGANLPLAAARKGWQYLDSASAGGLARVWVTNASSQKTTVAVQVTIPDLSTADEVFAAAPVSGRIVAIQTVIDAVITTGDAVVSFEIDTVAILGADITVLEAGAAVGDVDESAPTGLNVVTKGQTLHAITDGGSTVTCLTVVTFIIEID